MMTRTEERRRWLDDGPSPRGAQSVASVYDPQAAYGDLQRYEAAL